MNWSRSTCKIHRREPATPSVFQHIEGYKPWLALRPGQNKPVLTTATITHRLSTLRMFFVRLDEWGWDEALPRVPMFPGDLPRGEHPLPKALDDASAAKLRRAAQNDRQLLVRVTVEMLLRTGLRGSEYTSLRADAVVQIGAGPWLHVPVGKLRQDRYLPLHPQLVALIDDYRADALGAPTRRLTAVQALTANPCGPPCSLQVIGRAVRPGDSVSIRGASSSILSGAWVITEISGGSEVTRAQLARTT
jgi:site-specific recombinase XerD